MTSSGKNGLNIRTNASPKWDCEKTVNILDLPTNNETGNYNLVNHIVLTKTDVKEISNIKMMIMIQQHEHV